MEFFKAHTVWFVSFALAVIIVGGYRFLFSPPTDFPTGSIVIIPLGASAPSVARELQDAHVIRHPALLRLIVTISGESDGIQAGAYRFPEPQNLFIVAYRIVTGAYGAPPARVTLVEGATVREAAARAAETFPGLSAADFLEEGKSHEGYLFPDTYFFPPPPDAESVVKAMRANFNAKIAPLSGEIRSSGHSLSDIVIMASLIEKEARTEADRRMIAGILWNRLALDMPLQVDAVFGYIHDRDTYSPSFSDLAVESPYNVYLHTGLPPGPICNPGLDSIEAALRPTKTDYLYYLTGRDGLMHYAITYAAHQANQRKYLN